MKKIITLIIICFSLQLHAQDWSSSLDSSSGEKDFVIATFKSTRLINQQTLESVGKRTLDFRISHRFGPVNSGSYGAWGIDGPVNIRLGLDYSFDGRLMFGIGRTSVDKIVDGFLKYRLLRQTTDGNMPVSVTLFAGMYYTAINSPVINGVEKYENSTSRYSYAYEIMIGRKFSRKFSFQLAPWMVHYNLVDNIEDKNDAFGLAAMFRYKFTNRSAVTAEYGYRMNDYAPNTTYYDSFSIGYELETGGHVFQVHFTNSFGLIESEFFPHTDTKWDDMGIRLGFNISRVFTL